VPDIISKESSTSGYIDWYRVEVKRVDGYAGIFT